MNLYSFFSFFFILFNFIYNYSEIKKNKAKACLIIFRVRMLQDSIKYKKVIEYYSSQLDNAEYKIIMMSLTNCYSLIQENVTRNILEKVNNKQFINSLDDNYKDLISFDKIPDFDSDEFAYKMEEFTNVYNEVSENMNLGFDKNDNNFFIYGKYILIIFVGLFFIIIILVFYYICFKKTKLIQKKKIN